MKLNEWTVVLAAAGIVSWGGVATGAEAAPAAKPATDAAGWVASPTPAPTTTPSTSPSGTVVGSKANLGFWSRWDQAWREQLGAPAFTETPAPAPGAPAPAPTRRGLPAPFDSPPFPTGEWQLGGTPSIGDPNLTPDSPLMEALYQGPHGQAWADSRVKFYGWVDGSANLSTSQKSGVGVNGQAGNFPLSYGQRPNQVELDQAVYYLERTPDEFQTDHVDWGFRVSGVYGLDYRYMISRGLFSNQLIVNNRFYGYDMPMVYADLYLPQVAQGMNIRVGRIISEADIEAQLAPNNPMSTHSLLYTFDPYTMEGIFTSTKLNDQWTVQAGLANGNDVALWQKDRGNQPTGVLMLQYVSKDNKFSFYGGANSFNNGDFGYNNLQQFVGTLSYKFNEKVWTSWETWYMFMHHATTGPTAAVPYQNGFFPVKAGYAPEWATLDYTMFRLGPGTFFTVRNEIFNDIVGQRTGYNTVYTENAVGITYWPDKLITFRPEIRFDHSYAKAAYDNGSRHNQLVGSFDIILYF